jgi:hypothetical protein
MKAKFENGILKLKANVFFNNAADGHMEAILKSK